MIHVFCFQSVPVTKLPPLNVTWYVLTFNIQSVGLDTYSNDVFYFVMYNTYDILRNSRCVFSVYILSEKTVFSGFHVFTLICICVYISIISHALPVFSISVTLALFSLYCAGRGRPARPSLPVRPTEPVRLQKIQVW